MVKIRRMQPDDVNAVYRLWLEMMQEHQARDPHFAIASDCAEEQFLSYLLQVFEKQDTAVFVAEVEDRVIGYVLVLVFDNSPMFTLKKYGFIGEMSVTTEFRRSGVGRQLWDRAVGWFRRKGVETVQLNVSTKNIDGKAFWASLGFEDFLEVKWLDLKKD